MTAQRARLPLLFSMRRSGKAWGLIRLAFRLL